MRLVGPNTQGLANFGTGAVASFSTLFSEVEPQDGPVAVVSQSGGVAAMVYGLLRGRGIGVRHVHATGNEADVNVAAAGVGGRARPAGEAAAALLREPSRDAALLADGRGHARERDLPIVAVKAGRTAGGQQGGRFAHRRARQRRSRGRRFLPPPRHLARARSARARARRRDVPEGLAPRGHGAWWCQQLGRELRDGGRPRGGPRPRARELAAATRAAVAAKLPASPPPPIRSTSPPRCCRTAAWWATCWRSWRRILRPTCACIAIPVTGAGYDVARSRAMPRASPRPPASPSRCPRGRRPSRRRFARRACRSSTTRPTRSARSRSSPRHAALLGKRRAPWPPAGDVEVPPGAGAFLDEAQSLALLARHGLPVVAHRLCASRRRGARRLRRARRVPSW